MNDRTSLIVDGKKIEMGKGDRRGRETIWLKIE
jgi:hypothetical protein